MFKTHILVSKTHIIVLKTRMRVLNSNIIKTRILTLKPTCGFHKTRMRVLNIENPPTDELNLFRLLFRVRTIVNKLFSVYLVCI